VVFVADGSDSISDAEWTQAISFLNQLVGRLDVDSGSTRVGAVTFSSAVGTSFNLDDHSTVAQVQSAISGLVHQKDGTDTEEALIFVRTDMLIASEGDRADVPNVVVVITDGKSKDKADTLVCIMRKLIKQVYGCTIDQELPSAGRSCGLFSSSSSSSFNFKANEMSKSIQIKAGTTRQESALTVALK